jgi:hypothetical protein
MYKEMEAEDFFKNGKVFVWNETFCVVKAKRPVADAFAVIQDKKDITVIIDQSRLDKEYIIDVEKDWKVITFDMVLPFSLVGFIAKVSKALADEKISIFTISAYSTDHILVKKKDLVKAIKKIEGLGCVVGYQG